MLLKSLIWSLLKVEPSQLLQAAMGSLGGMGRFVRGGPESRYQSNIAWAKNT